nr:11446_t:CDS:2 [Entrophospora candida]
MPSSHNDNLLLIFYPCFGRNNNQKNRKLSSQYNSNAHVLKKMDQNDIVFVWKIAIMEAVNVFSEAVNNLFFEIICEANFRLDIIHTSRTTNATMNARFTAVDVVDTVDNNEQEGDEGVDEILKIKID